MVQRNIIYKPSSALVVFIVLSHSAPITPHHSINLVLDDLLFYENFITNNPFFSGGENENYSFPTIAGGGGGVSAIRGGGGGVLHYTEGGGGVLLYGEGVVVVICFSPPQ